MEVIAMKASNRICVDNNKDLWTKKTTTEILYILNDYEDIDKSVFVPN